MDKCLMFIVNPRAGRTRSTAPLFEAVARFSDAGYLVSVRQTARSLLTVQVHLDYDGTAATLEVTI